MTVRGANQAGESGATGEGGGFGSGCGAGGLGAGSVGHAPGEGNASARRLWMGVVAKAPPQALAGRLAALSDLPEGEALRGPETGTVMVRGRAGGTGAAFNLGEMTVSRCTLRLPDGTVGHSIVQGRDGRHAWNAALIDALMQGARAREVRAVVLVPLEQEAAAAEAERAARADTTRVEFFTLARGETE